MKKWEKPEIKSIGIKNTKAQKSPVDMYNSNVFKHSSSDCSSSNNSNSSSSDVKLPTIS